MKESALEVKVFHEKNCSFLSPGKNDDLVAGILDPRLKDRVFDAKDYYLGLAFASPRSINSIGESIILGGNCFSNSTDETSLEYLQSVYGPKFYATASLLLPKETSPNGTIKTSKKLRLSTFYKEVFEEVNFPTIGFVGLARFKAICVASIVKPPIDGVSFIDNKKYYLPFPAKVIKSTFGVLVGVINKEGSSKKHDKRFKTVITEYLDGPEENSSLKYVNLLEEGIHVKALFLRLREQTHDYNHIIPSDVLSVHRVYQRESILSEFKGEYFLIEDIKNILDS